MGGVFFVSEVPLYRICHSRARTAPTVRAIAAGEAQPQDGSIVDIHGPDG